MAIAISGPTVLSIAVNFKSQIGKKYHKHQAHNYDLRVTFSKKENNK